MLIYCRTLHERKRKLSIHRLKNKIFQNNYVKQILVVHVCLRPLIFQTKKFCMQTSNISKQNFFITYKALLMSNKRFFANTKFSNES